MTSSDERRLIVHGTVASGAILALVVLGIALDWPVAIIVLLAVVLVGVTGLSVRQVLSAGRAPAPPPPRQEAADQTAPEPESVPVGPTPVPSATDGYAFDLTATAHWRARPGRPGRVPEVLRARACDLLLNRAVEITRTFAPSDGTRAGLRLGSVLGQPHGDPDAGVDVWATDVEVGLAEEDRARLRRLDEIDKNVHLARRERAWEQELREYLGGEVLQSTGSALVWWLARHIEEIDGAVAHIPALTRISDVAQNRVVPTSDYQSPVLPTTPWTIGEEDPGAVDEQRDHDGPAFASNGMTSARHLIESLAPDDGFAQQQAARYLAVLAERWDRIELARAIRQEFAEPAAHPGTPSGDAAEPQGADPTESTAAPLVETPTDDEPTAEEPTPDTGTADSPDPRDTDRSFAVDPQQTWQQG